MRVRFWMGVLAVAYLIESYAQECVSHVEERLVEATAQDFWSKP